MQRRAVTVRGIVQGVGFRPFVYQLAAELGLRGYVQNQTGTVRIEVEGESAAVEAFCERLRREAPVLAQIESVAWEPLSVRGEADFRIDASAAGAAPAIFISPDVATCDDCLRELFDPRDRRHRYPFINCTNCGPRLTIITGAPYDRERTTMRGFAMCGACRSEYEDPADRRFHAQPVACPACGPRLTLLDERGLPIDTDDPLRRFAERIASGQVGALKGLGGYHLTCDAGHAAAVGALRARKHREDKPFAVMVADAGAAGGVCALCEAERELLVSPRRPIVLLRKLSSPRLAVADAVAPGNPLLGVMLPYTPVHHLLMEAVGGRPLVMTSANRSDEPIVFEDEQAVGRLSGIAEVYLVHDRAIHVRCDDSVTRVVGGVELPVRRSRGDAPRPVPMPMAMPAPLLAVGGQLKNTFALGRERHAFLSHHMGDLDDYEAYRAFEKDVGLYEALFEVRPACIVHDEHPAYASTGYARRRGEGEGAALLGVQHHHAHLASCMADNGLDGRVVGVTFDGTGYGADAAVWGGEVLVGGYARYRRAAHLRYVGLAGGDAAIHEPWRMAAAHLLDAGCGLSMLEGRIDAERLAVVGRMLERGLNAPPTSSAGRLFDAVAAIAGLRQTVTYEGQAAIELEWRAGDGGSGEPYPFAVDGAAGEERPVVMDTRPLIRAVRDDVAGGVAVSEIAGRFHRTMARMIRDVVAAVAAHEGLDRVVVSGGVFMNRLLTERVTDELGGAGLRVYRHRQVPPNDGGLSLGQLAVGAARFVGG